MIFCLVCGVANRDGSRFCNACGRRVDGALECAGCGAPNPLGSRFCSQCGAALGPQPLAAPTAQAALEAPRDDAQPWPPAGGRVAGPAAEVWWSELDDAEGQSGPRGLRRAASARPPDAEGALPPPGRARPQGAGPPRPPAWERAVPPAARGQPRSAEPRRGLAVEAASPARPADAPQHTPWPPAGAEAATPAATDEPSWAGHIAAAAVLGVEEATWTDVTPERPPRRSVAGGGPPSAEDLSLFVAPPAGDLGGPSTPAPLGEVASGSPLRRAASWEPHGGPTRAPAPTAHLSPELLAEAIATLRRIVGVDPAPLWAEHPGAPAAAEPARGRPAPAGG
ncbi:MAG: zinc ribbon domain-containing protein [Chloroflexi bacterium]|nr:zinc ribbon domain-containing protein [Chloroflexota bacterium]